MVYSLLTPLTGTFYFRYDDDIYRQFKRYFKMLKVNPSEFGKTYLKLFC